MAAAAAAGRPRGGGGVRVLGGHKSGGTGAGRKGGRFMGSGWALVGRRIYLFHSHPL